jgi:hypothetical protein
LPSEVARRVADLASRLTLPPATLEARSVEIEINEQLLLAGRHACGLDARVVIVRERAQIRTGLRPVELAACEQQEQREPEKTKVSGRHRCASSAIVSSTYPLSPTAPLRQPALTSRAALLFVNGHGHAPLRGHETPAAITSATAIGAPTIGVPASISICTSAAASSAGVDPDGCHPPTPIVG